MPDLSDERERALILARGRIVTGLILLIFPGVATRLLFGRDASTPVARALARMMGIRDVLLGVGAVTSIKEKTMDAEWVGCGAVSDAIDGVAVLIAPGIPKRARLVPLISGAASAIGMHAARAIADSRAAESVADAPTG
jgi:hypothetical protein